MKNIILLFCFLALYNSTAQTTEAGDKEAILSVMKLQEKAIVKMPMMTLKQLQMT